MSEATAKSETGSLLLIAGAILAYSLFRKASGLGTLNFFPDKVRDLRFEGMTPVLVIGLGVQNTSNQSFTIRSLAGNLYSNDYYVGNISAFQQTPILPNSETILYLTARMQLIGIVNDIVKAFQYNNYKQEIVMQANANVDGLQVPINQKLIIGA